MKKIFSKIISLFKKQKNTSMKMRDYYEDNMEAILFEIQYGREYMSWPEIPSKDTSVKRKNRRKKKQS